jgi:hypothetical protein
MRESEPRVRRTRRGWFELRLPRQERDALRLLPGQLRELLESNDPALERLFPPAYGDDAQRSDEYARMVGDDLVAHHRSSLEVMEETIDAHRLSEAQMVAWLGALNDLRLVLGTRLDVTEDLDPEGLSEEDPRGPSLALYFYLGWLEEQVVAVLAEGVDPAGAEG